MALILPSLPTTPLLVLFFLVFFSFFFITFTSTVQSTVQPLDVEALCKATLCAPLLEGGGTGEEVAVAVAVAFGN